MGLFALKGPQNLSGTAILTPEGVNAHITATEASSLCGVTVAAITNWVLRGHLTPVGINHRGQKLYRLLDVAKAERATRERARR